jgi:hypothetical protein
MPAALRLRMRVGEPSRRELVGDAAGDDERCDHEDRGADEDCLAPTYGEPPDPISILPPPAELLPNV